MGYSKSVKKPLPKRNLQTRTEKFEELLRVKLKIESEFNAINEEMQSIRQMTREIQQTLGILGQGGGSKISWTSEETEGQISDEQENLSTPLDAAIYAPCKPGPPDP